MIQEVTPQVIHIIAEQNKIEVLQMKKTFILLVKHLC